MKAERVLSAMGKRKGRNGAEGSSARGRLRHDPCKAPPLPLLETTSRMTASKRLTRTPSPAALAPGRSTAAQASEDWVR